ncbi:MAG: hypothetical protein ABMB14_02200 [Myxococcota bacterium]
MTKWLLWLAACSGEAPPVDTATDTGTTDPGDTDTGTVEDPDTDTGTVVTTPDRLGVLHRLGAASVSTEAGYDGTETIELRDGQNGDGAVVCSATVRIRSTAERTDCAGCDWAYDVVTSESVITIDEGGCLPVLGVTAASAGELDGVVIGYGYDSDYFGHSSVLETDRSGAWAASSNAIWDEATSAFTYDWTDGTYAY